MSNKTISVFWGVTGVIIALIGGGLMWVYPEKKWIGWVLIGLGVLVFFGFVFYLIRALNQMEANQNLLAAQPQQQPQGGINVNVNPVFNNNPQQTVSQSQNHPPPKSQPQHEETRPPYLEPIEIGTRVEKATINIDRELQEKSAFAYNSGNLKEVDFAFAELYRGVDSSPEPFVEVRAHIQFFDNNEKLLFRIKDAHWRRTKGKFAAFRVGDSDELLIGMVVRGKVFPYAGHYETVKKIAYTKIEQFIHESRELQGKKFRVHVDLIGVRGSKPTLNQSFDYDLITDPEPDLRLREVIKIDRQRAREELLPLLREGQGLERRIPEAMHDPIRAIYSAYQTWSQQVERSLKLYLDDSYVARFRVEEQDTWTETLRNKVTELEKIIRELTT